jgi:hypothetical protein
MESELRLPSQQEVDAAGERFFQENRLVESALTELLARYPCNADPTEILLKVVAINALYSTQIPVYSQQIPNVEDVAKHMLELDIDGDLNKGDPDLVERIAYIKVDGKKQRNYFSFATKYCSWHYSEKYPIWDSNVERYLTHLQITDPGFAKNFKIGGSWKYRQLRDAMDELKTHYKVESSSYKEIDSFLYYQGAALRDQAALRKNIAAPAS